MRDDSGKPRTKESTLRSQAGKLGGCGLEEGGVSGGALGRWAFFPSAAEVSPSEMRADLTSVPSLPTEEQDVWGLGCAPSLSTAC